MENMAHKQEEKSGRLFYLDLLRIFATLLIVVLHLVPLVHPQMEIASMKWRAANVISSLCRWCVPVFFMISGALFLSCEKEISTKRLYGKTLLRMLISFFVWSAMYALVHCLLNGKGKWTFLNQLLRGHYHMWYILAIISLYWITPLLRMITASKKVTEYFLLTGFLFSFVFSRVLGFVQLFELPLLFFDYSVAGLYRRKALCSLFAESNDVLKIRTVLALQLVDQIKALGYLLNQ